MFKNKPITLLIAAGLLILLIIATGLFQFFFTGNLVGLSGGRPEGLPSGSMPAGDQFPSGGNPPDGVETMPSSGNRPEGGDFQPGDMPSTGSDLHSFPGGQGGRTATSMKLNQLLKGIQIGAAMLIMLLAVLSVVGILCAKKWGQILAIITSILAILSVLPNLFNRLAGITLAGVLVKCGLALVILVLCFLPKRAKVTETLSIT